MIIVTKIRINYINGSNIQKAEKLESGKEFNSYAELELYRDELIKMYSNSTSKGVKVEIDFLYSLK